MNALLWTLIIVGGLNTASLLVNCVMQYPVQYTKLARIVDALYCFGLMVWAITLLGKP